MYEKIISVENTFQSWLENELKTRGWTLNYLARRAGLSGGTLNNIMSGVRGVGFDTCKAVAEALNVPPVVVFRAAGLLPPEPEDNQKQLHLWHLFSQLDQDDQEDIFTLIEAKIQRKQSKKSVKK